MKEIVDMTILCSLESDYNTCKKFAVENGFTESKANNDWENFYYKNFDKRFIISVSDNKSWWLFNETYRRYHNITFEEFAKEYLPTQKFNGVKLVKMYSR